MIPKERFDDDGGDDDDLENDRISHVELRAFPPREPGAGEHDQEPASERREIRCAPQFLALVPKVILRGNELRGFPLDHREGFLLSLVDGVSSVETILDMCAMEADEAIAILVGLRAVGILAID